MSREELCDWQTHCAEGEDEDNCLALSPTVLVEENVLGYVYRVMYVIPRTVKDCKR